MYYNAVPFRFHRQFFPYYIILYNVLAKEEKKVSKVGQLLVCRVARFIGSIYAKTHVNLSISVTSYIIHKYR